MTATKESIRSCAAGLGLTMTSEFVPWSKSRNAGEKHRTLNFKVTLHKDGRAFLTTDYSAGVAHAPGYAKQSGDSASGYERDQRVAWECEHGKPSRYRAWGCSALKAEPIVPEIADVLYSLSLDSSVLDFPTYEDWAGEYGYDADSRKGEATYRACIEIALKMRAGLGEAGMRQLADAVQDY